MEEEQPCLTAAGCWGSDSRPPQDFWTYTEDAVMAVEAQLDAVGELVMGVTSQMESSQSSSGDDQDSTGEGILDMDWTDNPLSGHLPHPQDLDEGDQAKDLTGDFLHASPDLRKHHQQEVDLLSQGREDCGTQEDNGVAARLTTEDREFVDSRLEDSEGDYLEEATSSESDTKSTVICGPVRVTAEAGCPALERTGAFPRAVEDTALPNGIGASAKMADTKPTGGDSERWEESDSSTAGSHKKQTDYSTEEEEEGAESDQEEERHTRTIPPPVDEEEEKHARTIPPPVGEEEERHAMTIPPPVGEEEERHAMTIPPPVGEEEERHARTITPPVGEEEERHAMTIPPPVGEEEERHASSIPPPVGEEEERHARIIPPPVGEEEERHARTIPPPVGEEEEEERHDSSIPPPVGKEEEGLNFQHNSAERDHQTTAERGGKTETNKPSSPDLSKHLQQSEPLKHAEYLGQSLEPEEQDWLSACEEPKVKEESSKTDHTDQSEPEERSQEQRDEGLKQTDHMDPSEGEVRSQEQRDEGLKQTDHMDLSEAEKRSQEQIDEGSKQTDHMGPSETEKQSQEQRDGRAWPIDHIDQSGPEAVPHANGRFVDREAARSLAERLYRLDDMRPIDVVKHMDKDNEFSRAVGEEYLKFFDFNGQSLERSLRSFLKVVVLIGETQERERVLEHFAQRFHQCNPDCFSSPGVVLTLTCAVMLLNTDLHGQNVGKAMTVSSFVSNLEGMNDGANFCKDMLKNLYSSIKSDPLEWAVNEEELKCSLLPEEEKTEAAQPRSKSNPFQDVPHDKKATVYKHGFLTRKAHADIDGKRTPWGKRSWKTFYAVLKGMVLYLQKDEYRMEWQSSEEVVSVHHALAEKADDYTKKPHVFRLQTADWRVFLFQASSAEQMSSWISRINLVSALYSSPPFPAAVGSQRKFTRPILPATQSTLPMDKQMESHCRMLESFSEDLTVLVQSLPEGRKAKAREMEEYKLREEYLQHEKSRYEIYKQILGAWKGLVSEKDGAVGPAQLEQLDREMCVNFTDDELDEGAGLKKSHSSPSINLEPTPQPTVKVKRNISERRTYRKIIIPRRNREL